MPFLKKISKLQNPNTKNWNLGFGHWSFKSGFTLIELLVVITIIGILAALATVSYTNAQQKGRDGKRKADLKAVQQALELYYQTAGWYPDASSGNIRCNIRQGYNAQTGTTIYWTGGAFSCRDKNLIVQTFLQSMPSDPKYQSTTGYYYTSSDQNHYALYTCLENTNDPDKDSSTSTVWGTSCSTASYTVKNP